MITVFQGSDNIHLFVTIFIFTWIHELPFRNLEYRTLMIRLFASSEY